MNNLIILTTIDHDFEVMKLIHNFLEMIYSLKKKH